MPTDMMEMLGMERTLRMGLQEVGEQFSYQSRQVSDGDFTGHMVYFRDSVAFFLAVYPDVSEVPPEGLQHLTID
jgi:hypothetical protein